MVLGQRRHGLDSPKIPIQGTDHDSDACSEYTSQGYTQTLAEERLMPSIGTIRDMFENAVETVMGCTRTKPWLGILRSVMARE